MTKDGGDKRDFAKACLKLTKQHVGAAGFLFASLVITGWLSMGRAEDAMKELAAATKLLYDFIVTEAQFDSLLECDPEVASHYAKRLVECIKEEEDRADGFLPCIEICEKIHPILVEILPGIQTFRCSNFVEENPHPSNRHLADYLYNNIFVEGWN